MVELVATRAVMPRVVRPHDADYRKYAIGRARRSVNDELETGDKVFVACFDTVEACQVADKGLFTPGVGVGRVRRR